MDIEKIKNILIKKAEGFFYREVQEEYNLEKKPKGKEEKNIQTSSQINVEDLFYFGENVAENKPNDDKNEGKNEKLHRKSKKSIKNEFIQQCVSQKQGVQCGQDDREEEQRRDEQTNEEITLVKKKVTAHYIPPDLLAIKMLFEIDSKEINTETMTDKELVEYKKQLISSLGELLKNEK